ncbi:MAG: phage portal protein, partial [Dehalococcoidia bacterium]|nr:phage portal protein [Dehalococcoidia bacterium]
MVMTRIASAFLGLAGTILQATDPDPVAQSIRDWIAKQEQDLRNGYSRYQRYYLGEQDVQLTNRLRQFLPPNLQFRDNFCQVVVDVVAERLKVESFASPTDEGLTEWVQELWRLNRMDQEQIVVHSEALLKGDAYVLVDYDEEARRPRLTFQPPDTITPRYDPVTRKMAYVAKKWLAQSEGAGGPVTRMNLYYPDRIEKYVLYGAVWRPFQEDGDEAWPLPWMDQSGAPLGITLIHFRNRPMSDDFGISE